MEMYFFHLSQNVCCASSRSSEVTRNLSLSRDSNSQDCVEGRHTIKSVKPNVQTPSSYVRMRVPRAVVWKFLTSGFSLLVFMIRFCNRELGRLTQIKIHCEILLEDCMTGTNRPLMWPHVTGEQCSKRNRPSDLRIMKTSDENTA